MSDGWEYGIRCESTAALLNYNSGLLIVQRTLFSLESTMELFIKYVCRATVFLFISGFEIRSHIACDVFVFHRSCIWNARDGGRRLTDGVVTALCLINRMCPELLRSLFSFVFDVGFNRFLSNFVLNSGARFDTSKPLELVRYRQGFTDFAKKKKNRTANSKF